MLSSLCSVEWGGVAISMGTIMSRTPGGPAQQSALSPCGCNKNLRLIWNVIDKY